MDVQGAEKARPWVEKAEATYPALVDPLGELGRQFHFNFVPLTLLFDEQGRLVRGPVGTDIDEREDWVQIARWLREGSIETPSQSRDSKAFSDPNAELRFQAAATALSRGEKSAALTLLRKALEFDPENWIIRKQIWAIEHPDRFYQGPVDFQWQKEQLRRERPKTNP